MKTKILLFMASLALLGSCQMNVVTKGSYIRLVKNGDETRSIDPSDVTVYYKKSPDYEYKEIGIVEAVAKGPQAGLKDLFAELRKQAVAAGAIGVYKIEIQRHGQSEESLHATAIAIVKATKQEQ